MNRTIKVMPRRGANAVYMDMSTPDQDWILQQLERILIETAARDLSTDVLDQQLRTAVREPYKSLGRSPQNGMATNTIMSVVGGVLSNIRLNGTRNLTDKICDKIETIFDVLASGADAGILPDLKILRVDWARADQPTGTFARLFE